MPALNRCQLSAVPKQEQILLDRGQRAVNPRLTKVNRPSEAGPVTVNQTPPRPGRSCDVSWGARTSGLVLPASGETVFLPDTSLLCISIRNSDCLFPLSFDQVVKRPGRPNRGQASPIRARDLTVTAHRPNQTPPMERKEIGKRKTKRTQQLSAAWLGGP